MSMRTPLKNVRKLGSAKEGANHFWLQRVTGLANLVLGLSVVVIAVCLAGADHKTTVDAFRSPFVAIPVLLFVVASAVHMRLGMQVIIEDYLHHKATKIIALLMNTFLAIGAGAVAVLSILKLSLGG